MDIYRVTTLFFERYIVKEYGHEKFEAK